MSRDLLGVCNDRGQPVEEFRVAWCARCLNPECGRSLHGKMKMDQRAATWEQKLFTNVARLDPSDPRHPQVTGQSFVTVDLGPTPNVRTDWVDPREAPTVPDRPTPVELLTTPAQPSDPASPPEAKPAGFQAKEAPPGPHLFGVNAPSQAGRILPGKAGQPAADPWAAPLPPKPATAPVVPPGVRVRLGGGVQKGRGDNDK